MRREDGEVEGSEHERRGLESSAGVLKPSGLREQGLDEEAETPLRAWTLSGRPREDCRALSGSARVTMSPCRMCAAGVVIGKPLHEAPKLRRVGPDPPYSSVKKGESEFRSGVSLSVMT